jgi:hypothetical protein
MIEKKRKEFIAMEQLGPAVEDPFVERLRSVFKQAGWRVAQRKTDEATLRVTRGETRYVVILLVASEARGILLESLLANAMIRAGALAGNGWQTLALVGAPSISDRQASELAAYAARYLPGRAYGLVDDRERLNLVGANLEGLSVAPTSNRFRVHNGPTAQLERPFDLFSDKNQWALKVLLASHVDGGLLAAQRRTIAGVSQLAQAAEISAPTASRLIRHLKSNGNLALGRQSLELVRLEALLAAWQAAAQRPCREIKARPIFYGSDHLPRLLVALRAYAGKRIIDGNPAEPIQWRDGQRACLGLFAACDQLGLGFVTGVPAHIYLESFEDTVLDELGLRPAEQGEPTTVVLREPRWPETVFRGAVMVNGVPVADIVQCWLDVAAHPARGIEQATVIWDRVIHNLINRPEHGSYTSFR